MPGKSRKAKEKRRFKAVAVPQEPASVIPPAVPVKLNEPAVQISVPAAAGVLPKTAKPAAVSSYTYINRELITITLLSCVMLAVVIVVSIVLR